MKSNKDILSERELLQQINKKMDMLILKCAMQGREKHEQVKYLVGLGYPNSEIGTILATPKGTIDGIRADLKKGAKTNERQTA